MSAIPRFADSTRTWHEVREGPSADITTRQIRMRCLPTLPAQDARRGPHGADWALSAVCFHRDPQERGEDAHRCLDGAAKIAGHFRSPATAAAIIDGNFPNPQTRARSPHLHF